MCGRILLWLLRSDRRAIVKDMLGVKIGHRCCITCSASADLRPCGAAIQSILKKAEAGDRLSEMEITHLFSARGGDFLKVCESADRMRRETVGDDVTFIVNRNVNYTNVCSYHCQFCAFSKGKSNENLRGQPYVLDLDEVARGHAKLGTGCNRDLYAGRNSSELYR